MVGSLLVGFDFAGRSYQVSWPEALKQGGGQMAVVYNNSGSIMAADAKAVLRKDDLDNEWYVFAGSKVIGTAAIRQVFIQEVA